MTIPINIEINNGLITFADCRLPSIREVIEISEASNIPGSKILTCFLKVDIFSKLKKQKNFSISEFNHEKHARNSQMPEIN